MLKKIEMFLVMMAVAVVTAVVLIVVLGRGMVRDTWDRVVAEGPETTSVISRWGSPQ